MTPTQRKAKVGLLLIGSPRFRRLGEGTSRGDYECRQREAAERLSARAETLGEVIYPGITYSREQMQAAMDAFHVAHVDGVLAAFMSWAEDFTWVRFLRDMPPVPILFASLVREEVGFEDTDAEDDFIEFLSAGGLVGAQEASGSVARFARPMMETAVGTVDAVMARARVFFAAARARNILRQTTLGLLPSFNELMWSTYLDPYDVFARLGPEMRFLSVASLVEKIRQVSARDAEAAREKLSRAYAVLPQVDGGKFLASVRASIAVERLAVEAGVDLLALNDIDPVLLEHVGLRPGFLPCPDGEAVTVVPEGDIGGALATYVLKILSGRSVNFIEPFYIDAKRDVFVAGHAGPNDYTDPAGVVRIGPDVRFAKSNHKYAGAPFAWYVFPPGEKTMLHCSQGPSRFKLLVARVVALPTEHFISGYTHGLLRPVSGGCEELFDRFIRLGVTQHYALAPGNWTQEIASLANMLDCDFAAL